VYTKARSFRPQVAQLEPRCLLTGVNGEAAVASLSGQGNFDFVGASRIPGPDAGNDFQDIRIALSNLPSKIITYAQVRRSPAGTWIFNNPDAENNTYAAHLIRPQLTSPSAELYLDATASDFGPGNDYRVVVRYADGTWSDGTPATSNIPQFLLGSTIDVRLTNVDQNRRIAGKELIVEWVGQSNQDWVGTSRAVGPDGLVDAELRVRGLTRYNPNSLTYADGSVIRPNYTFKTLTITGPGGLRWEFGPNQGQATSRFAELVRPQQVTQADDSTVGRLFFHPGQNLANVPLTVTIVYDGIADFKTSTAQILGQATNASTAAPAPAPIAIGQFSGTVTWLGQAASTSPVPAPVRIRLNPPTNGILRTYTKARLSDPAGNAWSTETPADFVRPLTLGPQNGSELEISFPPYRDESGTRMSLRLFYMEGGVELSEYVDFEGGWADVGRRAYANLDGNRVVVTTAAALLNEVARLNALPADNPAANPPAFYPGTTIVLNSTQPFVLTQPLTLGHRMTIVGEGAVRPILQFAPPEVENPVVWGLDSTQGAIRITASHVALDNLRIEFTRNPPGFVRDTREVISARTEDLVGLTLTRLDVVSPRPATLLSRADTPRLFVAGAGTSGRIVGNTFRGGTVDVSNGPWSILDNTHRGGVANTAVSEAFAVRFSADVVFRGNHAWIDPTDEQAHLGWEAADNPGPVYRLLLLKDFAYNSQIIGNLADQGVGRPLPANNNEHEIILSEAYQARFEGRPVSVSTDGRVVRLSNLRGERPKPGAVVSIVEGPHAGRWMKVAQVLDAEGLNLLLDEPLPEVNGNRVNYAISVGSGFVNTLIQANTIDVRGTSSDAIVLTSYQFGLRVLDNLVIGQANRQVVGQPLGVTGKAFRITAPATQTSLAGTLNYVPQGWSHTPIFGLVFAGNTIRGEAGEIGHFGVEHAASYFANTGRVYFTGSFSDNRIEWTTGPTPFILVGTPATYFPSTALPWIDPGESRLSAPTFANLSLGPPDPAEAAQLRIPSGIVNANHDGTGEIPAGAMASLTFARSAPVPASNNDFFPFVVGQDNFDYVGPSTAAPDGRQDLHIRLYGLRPDVALIQVEAVQSGGLHRWALTNGNSPLIVSRARGSTTADIFLQPFYANGRSHFDIEFTYEGSTTPVDQKTARAVIADSALRVVPRTNLPASVVGLTGLPLAARSNVAATWGDFDGDGKADLVSFRRSSAEWFLRDSATQLDRLAHQFGAANLDIPVPEHFDNPGRMDLAVFRPGVATFFIDQSSGDRYEDDIDPNHADYIPIPADYDGDGKADLAVYRLSKAEWFIEKSTGGTEAKQFGAATTDRLVPADYDGDGKTDLAVFRPSTAEWFILRSSGGALAFQFGAANLDRPIPADYDGDGKTDLAVFRPTTAEWFISQTTGIPRAVQFGAANLDLPIPADYDGDGKADLGVFRPTDASGPGTWLIALSAGSVINLSVANAGNDVPVLLPLSYKFPNGQVDSFGSRSSTTASGSGQRTDGGSTARSEPGEAFDARLIWILPDFDASIPWPFDLTITRRVRRNQGARA